MESRGHQKEKRRNSSLLDMLPTRTGKTSTKTCSAPIPCHPTGTISYISQKHKIVQLNTCIHINGSKD
ncbi:hypothetical protein ACS0TY_032128 [Phlomoides rotata]